MGYGTAFSDYVAAVMKHEGFGDPTRGIPGHESLGRDAALKDDGDPLNAIESAVAVSEAGLRTRADLVLRDVAITLNTATQHTVGTGFGHWAGDIWVHTPDLSGYELERRTP